MCYEYGTGSALDELDETYRFSIFPWSSLMRRRILGTLTITAAIFAFAGCERGNPVAPTASAGPASAVAPPAAPSQSLLGNLLGSPQTIKPLLRTTPLASNLSASGTVGLLGATIAIRGAGLTLVVPPLAAPFGTRITVTALAGSNVAYEFEPHGLKFLLPVVAVQDLHGTQVQTGLVSPLGLKLGYFPDEKSVTSVTELLNVNVNLLNLTAVSVIWHFSGYIVAGGDSEL